MRQQRDLYVIQTPPGKYGCFNRPAQVECRYHHDDPMNRLDPKCMGCDHQMRPWREMGRERLKPRDTATAGLRMLHPRLAGKTGDNDSRNS